MDAHMQIREDYCIKEFWWSNAVSSALLRRLGINSSYEHENIHLVHLATVESRYLDFAYLE